ncbi:MAG TPA: hypothetical protein VG406_05220 [Isosphaeraceae bacterium]|jgi:hypothetical protein|nr:hypothetical protein [Isosphaeraceae bacterium]
MAAKKKTATKSATKKATTKKATKKGGVAVASETAAKSATPKAKKSAGTKAAGAKKAVKLNERQHELLKKVHGAGEAGYTIGQKAEQRTIDVLHKHGLLKRGKKNKDTGHHSYTVSKTGQKHISSAPAEAPK